MQGMEFFLSRVGVPVRVGHLGYFISGSPTEPKFLNFLQTRRWWHEEVQVIIITACVLKLLFQCPPFISLI